MKIFVKWLFEKLRKLQTCNCTAEIALRGTSWKILYCRQVEFCSRYLWLVYQSLKLSIDSAAKRDFQLSTEGVGPSQW